ATDDLGVYAGLAWQPEAILAPRLEENLGFMLGSTGLLVGTVPAGEIKSFRFAVGFFREGTATSGLRTRYLYRRWFDTVEQVLTYTLGRANELVAQAEAFDKAFASRLSPTRYFMAAHSIRSYFGCTQLLEREDGRPLWCVHEGEYRMMNTFDLTVDQAFFELALNPWTVRNVLDLFVERYSYVDEVRFPGQQETHRGGIAFTHDMGVSNTFSPPGHSGYEQAGLTGCFSYMSGEELMNWVLCAGLYVGHTEDEQWLRTQRGTLHRCLESMLNRDHPEASQRNGLMGLDGARCAGGAEITTYDSLDASLGQARNNVYLGVKGWASYLVLHDLFTRLDDLADAEEALSAARRAANTVIGAADPDGLLPAVVGEGVDARIIPAIEGLVYPHVLGFDDEFSELRAVLNKHFELVLKPGVCRFPDNGWRLSSTSRNSWLSKIYLCQYIAEEVFGLAPDAAADEAHKNWLLDEENVYYAWSDQMLEGKAVGSRYYPRGVTSILWTANGDNPLAQIEGWFLKTTVRKE
ncbi:MAG TPA: glycoside hydrolase family 52 protein, partial [Fimbriimonas sp.]|nr:glycoside hydrolase family 52 protein [Fimbriimonas sp.]